MPEDRSVLSRPTPPPDAIVRYGPEPEHVADVRHGGALARNRPLIVNIHGGFWRPDTDRTHTGPLGVALAESGWTNASIEYRRVPGQPHLTTGDVALALRTLPEHIDTHDGGVIVSGHSAGGHLALWVAATGQISGLAGALALAPVADLRLAHSLRLGRDATLAFLGGDASGHGALDPKRLPTPACNVTIVHGHDDEIVPIALAESYVATHTRARLVGLAGAAHFAVIDPVSDAWAVVVRELERLGV